MALLGAVRAAAGPLLAQAHALSSSSAAAAAAVAACQQMQQQHSFFATKAAGSSSSSSKASAKASEALIPTKDWAAVKLPPQTAGSVPTTTMPGQAFVGDLRSTSGLGKGDGINDHTTKWLQGDIKSPLEYIQEAPPIKVEGAVVASYGSDDPALGCPVEYINLKGTSKDRPAVCKYTGNKYYSDTWRSAH